MDLTHVHTFVAIVDEGGFRRAATQLHLTQPGVSHHVRQLELDLGRELFQRGPGGCLLTADGALFLRFARQMLTTEAAARERCAVGVATALQGGSTP